MNGVNEAAVLEENELNPSTKELHPSCRPPVFIAIYSIIRRFSFLSHDQDALLKPVPNR